MIRISRWGQVDDDDDDPKQHTLDSQFNRTRWSNGRIPLCDKLGRDARPVTIGFFGEVISSGAQLTSTHHSVLSRLSWTMICFVVASSLPIRSRWNSWLFDHFCDTGSSVVDASIIHTILSSMLREISSERVIIPDSSHRIDKHKGIRELLMKWSEPLVV